MITDCILTCTVQMGHLSIGEQSVSKISVCKVFTWIYTFEQKVE